MKKPNFLIIGAARSGSTTLAYYLALHPQVYLPKTAEEPKFFSREQEYSKGIEYYLNKYFSSANGYLAVGEKSTEYMENLSAAKRVYQFNRDIKLICILRDPVERVISNYWWSVHNGVESRPINEAILIEWENYLKNPPQITQLLLSRPHAYIDRSLYYDNLKPFYELFQRRNIRCIIFEDFIKNKKRIVDELWFFLGLSPVDMPIKPMKAQRAVERKEHINTDLYKKLKSFFYEKNKNLPYLIGIDVWQFWDENNSEVRMSGNDWA